MDDYFIILSFQCQDRRTCLLAHIFWIDSNVLKLFDRVDSSPARSHRRPDAAERTVDGTDHDHDAAEQLCSQQVAAIDPAEQRTDIYHQFALYQPS